MKCEAICLTATPSQANTNYADKRCPDRAVTMQGGRLLCWTHSQAFSGPRTLKGMKARYSPMRFAK